MPAIAVGLSVAVLAGALGLRNVVVPSAACPPDLAGKVTCYTGHDAGGYYMMAVPENWNRSLVVYSHGGPDAELDEESVAEDLAEWSVMVEQGYAWAGSSYRRGGYGVRMAAEDTESVRKRFTDRFGQPDRTYLHGQSWGGNVAAKAAETYPDSFDGLLLTSGNVAGGTRAYNHRVDLRAVYQYYCNALPRTPQWQVPLTLEELNAGLQACTGIDSSTRTPGQQRNLDDILAVTGLSAESLPTHLAYAAFLFQDIVWNRLDGRSPFSNEGVEYHGSHDDAALNAGVERYTADPTAVRDLSYDSDLTGRIAIPVLTLHAIGDPSVFVESQHAFKATLTAAGHGGNLVQTFTTEEEHNELNSAGYAAAIAALDGWVRTGVTPTPQTVADSCPECPFDPAFTPGPLESRIAPRAGGTVWPAMSAAQESEWSTLPRVGIAG